MPRERLDKLGEHYLFRDKPGGTIYLGWQIADPNRPGRSRTERESCGTADVKAAREMMIARHFVTRQPRDHSPDSMLFAELVMDYTAKWLDRGKIRSVGQIKRSLGWAVERFGDQTVYEVGSPEMQDWGEEMIADGRAPAYVQRIINDVRGMYNRATERRWLMSAPKISLEWLGAIEGRDIFAEIEPARAFWNAIDDQRLAIFTILAANTGARTERICELTADKIDLESGTIDLRKPGEKPRDKKRNPIVKITKTLRPWLANLDGGFIVGARKRCIYGMWRKTRDRAGLDESFVPTIWRHTLNTLLDEKVEDQWVRRWFVRANQEQMIDWYTKRRVNEPDYCKPCVDVIDAYMAKCGMSNSLHEAKKA